MQNRANSILIGLRIAVGYNSITWTRYAASTDGYIKSTTGSRAGRYGRYSHRGQAPGIEKIIRQDGWISPGQQDGYHK